MQSKPADDFASETLSLNAAGALSKSAFFDSRSVTCAESFDLELLRISTAFASFDSALESASFSDALVRRS